MSSAFSIDPDTGHIHLGDEAVLAPHQDRAAVAAQMALFPNTSRDLHNGYAWLDLNGLTFGGTPATLSLCFHDGLLRSASWNVLLADAETQDGWPTRKAVDAEVAFIRKGLKTMGLRTGPTAWGDVWSAFEPRESLASSGLRYR